MRTQLACELIGAIWWSAGIIGYVEGYGQIAIAGAVVGMFYIFRAVAAWGISQTEA